METTTTETQAKSVLETEVRNYALAAAIAIGCIGITESVCALLYARYGDLNFSVSLLLYGMVHVIVSGTVMVLPTLVYMKLVPETGPL